MVNKKAVNDVGVVLVPMEVVERRIFVIRGKKVMLDRDLAELYGVATKRINEQVKRNAKRFPVEFMFRLSVTEKNELVANCDRLRNLKHSVSLPYAFTEHGVTMLANVLNSETAIRISIDIVKAFINFRTILSSHKELARKLEKLEKRIDQKDEEVQAIFEAIRELMEPSVSKNPRKIGFTRD
jgi:phage regulator Rha-like protein